MSHLEIERHPPGLAPSVSWAAIAAGAVTAGATTLALVVLAAALGLTQISPWYEQNATATTFAVSSAVGLIVVQWVSAAMGGYIAGRLRPSWSNLHGDETFFRDTAHGFLTWCVATLIVFVCAASMASALAAKAGQAAGGAASAIARGAAPAAAGEMQYFSDALFRGTAATPVTPEDRQEATRILLNAGSGEIAPADRDYLAQTIAARLGISPDDARKRVSDVTAQI